MSTVEDPGTVVLAYLEAFSSGDPDLVASHVANGFVNRQVGTLGEGCTGRNVYRERLVAFLAEFEDLTYEPDTVVVQGQKVAVGYEMKFTYGGKPVAMHGAMILTLEHGKIASRADYWDGVSFLRQTEASD